MRSVNKKRTDKAMVKRKGTKRPTIAEKTLKKTKD
jgi:hypothetical protein